MKNLFTFILLLVFSKAGAQTPVFHVADSLFAIGKYSEAISHYKKVVPKNAETQIKIAQAFHAQGNLGKSLTHYELALTENDKPVIISEYGKLLYRTGKFKKADSVFQQLAIHFPKNPDFHYQLGLAKEQLNDTTAIYQFLTVLELDPSHQKAIYKLAVQQFKKENYEKVEFLGKKALEAYPQNAEIIGLLGQNAMATRNFPIAVKRFERLLSLGEHSEFVHEKLGLAYYHLGELKKALEQYQAVIDLDPQHVNAYYFSGKIHNLLGETEKAKVRLKKALFLKKLGLSGMYHALGTTYKLQKNYDKAIEYYQLALEENEYNLRAQFDLALAADQYYKDLQTRLNYYKIFVRKFKDFPNAKPFLAVAEYRINELKKEKFIGKE